MKRSISRLLSPMLILCMMCLLSVSCRSVEPVTADTHHSSLVAHNSRHDTLVVRDSVFVSDSVVLRERTIHDTVYITKEVYRDRLEARGERQKAVRVDTVVVTEWREKVIEHPPERYVPKFYKWCTIMLFVLLAAGIMYLVIRWRLHL